MGRRLALLFLPACCLPIVVPLLLQVNTPSASLSAFLPPCLPADDLARRDRQLAQHDRDLADAQQRLQAAQPQLRRYKEWVEGGCRRGCVLVVAVCLVGVQRASDGRQADGSGGWPMAAAGAVLAAPCPTHAMLPAPLSGLDTTPHHTCPTLSLPRHPAADAEAEAKRQEEELAALRRDIGAEAERNGCVVRCCAVHAAPGVLLLCMARKPTRTQCSCQSGRGLLLPLPLSSCSLWLACLPACRLELSNGGSYNRAAAEAAAADEDAAWEQLAADIQETERAAAAAAAAAPAANGTNGVAAADDGSLVAQPPAGPAEEGAEAAPPLPPGPQQPQASDMQLQAAMQEAAMEGGWVLRVGGWAGGRRVLGARLRFSVKGISLAVCWAVTPPLPRHMPYRCLLPMAMPPPAFPTLQRTSPRQLAAAGPRRQGARRLPEAASRA